jgi:hypothetical protein
MKIRLIKLATALLFCAISLPASMLESGRSVVVMPLWFSYQVQQDFQTSYLKTESSIKGFAKEKSSDSYNESYRDGRYSSHDSSSSKDNFDGKYDLKKKSEYESNSYTDSTIVEKTLSTEKYTGMLESSLSEAGINLGTRQNQRMSDYILTGDVISIRMGNIRTVPDGTNRRYSVSSTLKISIKITDAKTGVSTFAKTFTGKGVKTFDAADYVPAEDATDMAMDEISAQLIAALTGKRVISPSESDAEYQDSPGKRLVE